VSATSSDAPGAESARADTASSLFRHEIRRDGRVIVTLRAVQTAEGVTVESEVFPLAQAPGEPGLPRPFSFDSLDHARRFADEALVAFEYLNCTIN
jgi:hypothetical protein